MNKSQKIRVFIFICIILGAITFVKSIFWKLFIPEKELTVEERIFYLVEAFKNDKNKYEKTIELIDRVDYNHPIGVVEALSRKQIPYELVDLRLNKSIKNEYPFFEKEMYNIWKGEQISCNFYNQNVDFGIWSNYTSSRLLYIKLSINNFVNNFRDTMEYCVYPQIPKSPKHWIIKLEDNWYLYDGYFNLEMK